MRLWLTQLRLAGDWVGTELANILEIINNISYGAFLPSNSVSPAPVVVIYKSSLST